MKVYNSEEYHKLWLKHRDTAVASSDEYVVRYRIQKEDGYWTTVEASYRATGKAAHDEVLARWQKDYPLGESIRVEYQ